MSDDRQIRSFQRVHRLELVLYSFGKDIRPPRPIPARAIGWFALCETVAFVLSQFPPGSLIGWQVMFVLFPAASTWLLTVALVEGRRAHTILPSLLRSRGRHLAGGHRRLESPGEHWKPKRVRVTSGRRS